MKTYYISQFPNPPFAIQIEQDPPPCLLCGDPVTRPSMGGPLICPPCDIGRNKDGTRVTSEQHAQRQKHARAQIDAHLARTSAEIKAENPFAADPIAADADPTWKIVDIKFSGGDVDVKFSGGDGDVDAEHLEQRADPMIRYPMIRWPIR